ncbi:UDP-N-acetylmuramoyl-L-alanine--D-glutamate ligase [Candidatus Berkelbacteria bacterium]|nr:UDP-N-acetylmuramoyl-L-alanine--D-glutamate ligase [Candidatus Berkelbacteria bacterium]
MVPEQLRGKRIGILGFGANHRALLVWLQTHGAESITVFDEKAKPEVSGVTVVSGPDAFKELDVDVLLRSPGIPLRRPELAAFAERGGRITSQTELFLELCPARTIGVTGTKGKGTTSSLIAHILDARRETGDARGRVYLAGNIGKDPFEFLDELTPDDHVVLELSSFQLDGIRVSPRIAVVLGISTDHLDHHESVAAYHDAKSGIVRYQGPGDVAVMNLDSAAAFSMAELAGGTVLYYSTKKSVDAGCYLQEGTYYWRDPRTEVPEELATVDTLGIRAPHNQENAAAAITVAKLLGVETSSIVASIQSFKGLPHRTELVAEIGEVRWVNDSYATVPDATIAALRAFQAPIVLIVGGSSKGADYAELGRAIAAADVKQLVTMGETGPQIGEAAAVAGFPRERIRLVNGLTSAVSAAKLEAKRGDVVLLSPASASFDQFKNAAERGEAFRKLVQSHE